MRAMHPINAIVFTTLGDFSHKRSETSDDIG
jgi:hypothetical protein